MSAFTPPPAPNDPSSYARSRGIEEILHFTTHKGLLGILSTGCVLSRKQLVTKGELDPIRLLNCHDRSKDIDWVDWVNLSITQVNRWMLNRSQGWHQDEDGVWWAVLAFDVSILDDDGVWFTTTNNSYAKSVKRGQGRDGLAALFAEDVAWGKYGSTKHRNGRADDLTTCDQAEVLYPRALPLTSLRHIYVADGENLDDIAGWVDVFPATPMVPVLENPSVFA